MSIDKNKYYSFRVEDINGNYLEENMTCKIDDYKECIKIRNKGLRRITLARQGKLKKDLPVQKPSYIQPYGLLTNM